MARQGDVPSIRIQESPRLRAPQAGVRCPGQERLLRTEEVALGTDYPVNERPVRGYGGAVVVVIGSIAILGFLLLAGGFQ